MKIGTITLNTKIVSAAFVGPSATEKARPGERLISLHLGTATIDSIQHFSADGALLALGYGPIALTRVQHGLVAALQAAAAYAEHPDEEAKDALREQVDTALAAAENFSKSAGPLIDPIVEDAMRFRFMLACACNPAGAEAMMANVVGEEMDPDEKLDFHQEQAKLIAILDEARRRLAGHAPSASTVAAMAEVERGEVTRVQGVDALMTELSKDE